MKNCSDFHTMMRTSHIKICSDVQNRVGTLQIKMCSNVQNKMGTPHIKMCSDVSTRVGHIAADTRLVKICWLILVIFSFVSSLSKQYAQSGDIYQFAQLGECRIILVIDGSFW